MDGTAPRVTVTAACTIESAYALTPYPEIGTLPSSVAWSASSTSMPSGAYGATLATNSSSASVK